MESAKHRTQISLEDWQYQILREVSKKTKKSLSTIIRDVVTEKFSKQRIKKESDTIFDIVGMAAGDGSPVAKEHDKFLYGKKK